MYCAPDESVFLPREHFVMLLQDRLPALPHRVSATAGGVSEDVLEAFQEACQRFPEIRFAVLNGWGTTLIIDGMGEPPVDDPVRDMLSSVAENLGLPPVGAVERLPASIAYSPYADEGTLFLYIRTGEE